MDYNIITLQLPVYTPETGLRLKWDGNYVIKITQDNGSVLLAANEDGLRSLANHLLCLADSKVPVNNHIHLDEYNSLEHSSLELIIEKIK